ncbi:MAG: 4Fe-4S binding protein [Pedosphaera parvula]|nr:4Fe-4S binding protein [Pedosphaera parvula]
MSAANHAQDQPIRSCGINLLRFAPLRKVVQWRAFPAVLQVAVLMVFIALAVLGWGRFTPEGVPGKLYAKSNLVNLVIWGLWWPAIIWVTVLFGRAWCMVCPLEFVSSRAESAAQRWGIRQRRLSHFIAAGSLAVCFFAVLQLLVPGIQLHRVPAYTSVFLVTMLAGAFVVGLVWRDRAFCRGFCPVSLLLNAYGRGGMLAMRPAEDLPAPAEDRDAVTSPIPAKAETRHCRSLLNTEKLNSNRDCLICGDCAKAAPGRTRLLLRQPFAAADHREALAAWPLTLVVMMVSGFVTFELCGVWKAAEPCFLWLPNTLSKLLHAGAWSGWIQGLWTVVIVPLLLWLALGGATLASGGAQTLAEAWRRLALPLAVIVAAGHMAKGLEKFTSWAGFLPYAFKEPAGVQTALAMSGKTLAQPVAWLSLRDLSVAAMVLVLLAVALAVREARFADPAGYRRRLLPVGLLGGFYFFLVFGWGNWGI